MKKSIAILLTISLLSTMTAPVLAGPGKGSTSDISTSGIEGQDGKSTSTSAAKPDNDADNHIEINGIGESGARKEKDATERGKTTVSVKDQKWMTRFVELASILNIELDLGTIEGIIQDAKSNILRAALLTDKQLLQEYGPKRIEDISKEFDEMLKDYNREIATPESEGRYSNVADAAEVLSNDAISTAVAMYHKASFDGFTSEESQQKIRDVICGNYNLDKSKFNELPNVVAIRRKGKVEVIPQAKYKTDIVTIDGTLFNDKTKIYNEKIGPIRKLVDQWIEEVGFLETEKGDIFGSVIIEQIYDFLSLEKITKETPRSTRAGSIIIATSSYNGQTQAITVGAISGQNYEVKFTFTAPHNLLAGEDSYQGAAQYLVSDVLRDVFYNRGVLRALSTITNPVNVKQSTKLGFRKVKKAPEYRRLSKQEADEILKRFQEQHSTEKKEPNRDEKVVEDSKQQSGTVSTTTVSATFINEITEKLVKLCKKVASPMSEEAAKEAVEKVELEKKLAKLKEQYGPTGTAKSAKITEAQIEDLKSRFERLNNEPVLTDREIDGLKTRLAKVSEGLGPKTPTELEKIDKLLGRLDKLSNDPEREGLRAILTKLRKESAGGAQVDYLTERLERLRGTTPTSEQATELLKKLEEFRGESVTVTPEEIDALEERIDLEERLDTLSNPTVTPNSAEAAIDDIAERFNRYRNDNVITDSEVDDLDARLAKLRGKAGTEISTEIDELQVRFVKLRSKTIQPEQVNGDRVPGQSTEAVKGESGKAVTEVEVDESLEILKKAPDVPTDKIESGIKKTGKVAQQDPASGKSGSTPLKEVPSVKRTPQVTEEVLQGRLNNMIDKAKIESPAGKVENAVKNEATELKGSTSKTISSEVPNVPKTSANVPKASGNVTEAESAEVTKTLAKLREQAFPELRAAANLERWAAPEVEGVLSRLKGLTGRIGANIEEMLASEIPIVGPLIDLAILVYQVYSDIEGEKEWTAQQDELSKKLTSLEEVLTQIEKETQPTWWEKNRWYFYWIPAVAIVDGSSYGIGKAMAAHPDPEQKQINDKWRELVQDIQKYVKVLHDIRDLSVDLKEKKDRFPKLFLERKDFYEKQINSLQKQYEEAMNQYKEAKKRFKEEIKKLKEEKREMEAEKIEEEMDLLLRGKKSYSPQVEQDIGLDNVKLLTDMKYFQGLKDSLLKEINEIKGRIETELSQEIKTELSQIKEKEGEMKQLESKIVAGKNEINRRQRAENEAREKYNLELQPVGGGT